MALNARCQNQRKNVTLQQRYRWYHFRDAAAQVCVHYLLRSRCLDAILAVNSEIEQTLHFYSFVKSKLLSLYKATKHNTYLS